MQVVRAAERKGIDVYAAYRTAKSQQKGKFKSRGFFKSKHPQGQSSEERQQELDQAKATSTCRACGAQGRWKKDPVRPKYQETQAAAKKAFAANMVAIADQVWLTEALTSDSSSCLCPEALGIIDSGCQKTVMGLFVFKRWEDKLLEHGVIQPVPCSPLGDR